MKCLIVVAPTIGPKIEQNIDWISKQIDIVLNEIKSTLDLDKFQKSEFSQINKKSIERAYKYLNECKKLKIRTQQVMQLIEQLEDFIKRASEILIKSFKRNYEKVITFGNSHEDIASLDYDFYGKFHQIEDILLANDILKTEMNTDKTIAELTRQFAADSKEMQHSIKQNNLDGNFKKLHQQLQSVKCLSQLDVYIIGAGKFIDIYHESRQSLMTDSSIVKDTMKDIDRALYSDVYLVFQNLEQNIEADIVHRNDLRNLKRYLKHDLERILQDCKTYTNQLRIRSNFEQIHNTTKDLYISLKKLYNANQSLKEYIPQEQDINHEIEKQQLIIQIIFKEYESTIEGYFRNIKLKQGEEGMKNLELMHYALGEFITQPSMDALVRLDKEKRDYLQTKKEELKKREITDYYMYPPKDLLEKLKDADSVRGEYLLDIQEIEDAIKQKIEEYIQSLLKEIDDFQYFSKKRALQNSSLFLTDKLAYPINNRLEMMDEHKKYELENDLSYLQTAIDNSDTKNLSKFIEGYDINKLSKTQKTHLALIKKFIEGECLRINSILTSTSESFTIQIKASLVLEEHIQGFPLIQGMMTDLKIWIKESWERQLFKNIDALVKHFALQPIKAEQNEKLIAQSMNSNVIFDIDQVSSYNAYNELNEFDALEMVISISKHCNDDYFTQIFPKFTEQIEKLVHQISKNYNQVQFQFEESIKNHQGQDLVFVLKMMKKWDGILQKITIGQQEQFINCSSLQNLVDKIRQYRSYGQMLQIISEVLGKLNDEFHNENLINQDVLNQKHQRDTFYEELSKKLTFLKQIKKHNFETLDPSLIETDCQQHLKKQIQKMAKLAKEKIQIEIMGKQDFKNFNQQFNHLSSAGSFIECFQTLIKDEIDIIKKLVLIKVQKHKNIAIQMSPETPLYDEVKTALIEIKNLSMNIPDLQQDIEQYIDVILVVAKNKLKAKGIAILGNKLQADEIGKQILMDHSQFAGVSLSLFNQKISRFTVSQIIEKLDGDGFDKQILLQNYNTVFSNFQIIVESNLNSSNDMDKINRDIKSILARFSKNKQHKINFRKKEDNKNVYLDWDSYNKILALELLALLFAYWTLMNSQHYFEAAGIENQNSYLFTPHPAQILSVLCMLGLSGRYASLKKNLVEIKTGEGKSITLAITATLLALLGFDVYSACYSKYLSQRDKETFQNYFCALEVDKKIKYGTFNSLSEDIINKQGNLRKLIVDILNNDINIVSNSKLIKNNEQRILLIDEVDVFFSKDFFGNTYSQLASLKDPTITFLIEYIWAQRDNEINFKTVQSSKEYLNCYLNPRFEGWNFLIEEAVKDMLNDIEDFETHDYEVKDQKIGYKQQDDIVFNALYGFKTLFAYYKELEKGTVTRANLENLLSIGINTGSFSYVEILQNFQIIMGVTGTLQSLSMMEKSVIKDDYNISAWVYAPSAFGNNQLNPVQEIHVRNKDEYHNTIIKEITDKLVGSNIGVQRAVLVFFETMILLNDFVINTDLKSRFPDYLQITEKSTEKEKDSSIKRASSQGNVTLLTREFGRGTDFISRDDQVNANGGVHVIQTFLSEEFSEETQIKGRTARQGERGSFSMVLLENHLEKFGISLQDLNDNKSTLQQYLNQKRDDFFRNQYQITKKKVELALVDHQVAMMLKQSILQGNKDQLKNILLSLNQGIEYTDKKVRTIILMDATGSMSNLLTKTKYAITTMFKRASEILKENRIPENAYCIQFAAFRNYSSGPIDILQCSPFESKSHSLEVFLNSITASGGQGREAIEIGLWHANQQNNKQQISQVILIGDAEANTKQDVQDKRDGRRWTGSFWDWSSSPYDKPAFYKNEVKQLVQSKIPVHAFYVDQNARQCFEEIANATGGQNGFLDVNNTKTGQKVLTDIITGQILRMVGQKQNLGDQLQVEYMKKYAYIE